MAVTKRYMVPKFWTIERKVSKYVVSPKPGPHSKMKCIPLGVILRDVLKLASTMKEANEILGKGFVKINGILRKEYNFPVGMMDVVDLDGDVYRVLPGKNGLYLHKTDSKDAAIRLAKIVNKTHVKEKKLQVNFHDGFNMLSAKDNFMTSDVAVIDVASKEIKQILKFDKGSFAIVTDGHNAGLCGVIDSIDAKLRTVVIESNGQKFLVPKRYVFVVGHGTSASINLKNGE